jgi:integration host factor subunit beta
MTMNRADLIGRVCEKGRMHRSRAELLVDTIFDCLERSLRQGEKIELRGFGTFQVRSYGAYKGRNPRTGQIVEVKPKRLPHFKVSNELADRVNGRRKTTDRTTEIKRAAERLRGVRGALGGRT